MTPLLFRRRSSKARLHDDNNTNTTEQQYDELDTSYKTDRYSNVVFQFHPNGTFASIPSDNNGYGAKLTKRALSMLEMNEVKEIHDFGDAVMDMNNNEEAVTAATNVAVAEGNDKQDDFLFLDDSECSRDNTTDNIVTVNESNDGCFIPSSSLSRGGIMCRSKSVASLSSQGNSMQDNLMMLSSLMTLSNIVEEKSSNHHHLSSTPRESSSIIIQEELDCQEVDEIVGVSTTLVPVKFNDDGEDDNNKQEKQKQEVSHDDDSNSCSLLASLNDLDETEVVGVSTLVPVKFVDSLNENDLDESIQSTNSNNNDRSSSNGNINNNNPHRSSLKRTESNSCLKSSIKSTDSIHSINTTSSSNNKLKRNNVSFTSLEIRSYPMTLGDAPTSTGPPITLDWDYDPTQSEVVTIDHYERHKTPRAKHEMFMPASHRQYLLMREAGVSRSAIKSAVKEARKIAKERERTRKNLRLQPVEEMVENTKRRIGRLVRK
eukprot:scaffold70262_cov88-Cyclotella_meneghiniana.AAC.5